MGSFTIKNIEQGTDEWFQARLGKVTASQFDKILTPKTLKPSAQQETVINMCVAELLTNSVEETFQSDAMLRGKDLEQQALEFFNFTNDFEFEPVGFVDSGRGFGCSPDGLWMDKKMGLELKCPLSHTHVKYLWDNTLPKEYVMQVQGSLAVTGFDAWVFGSYHPELKCFTQVIEPDPKIIEPFKEELEKVTQEIAKRHSKLLEQLQEKVA